MTLQTSARNFANLSGAHHTLKRYISTKTRDIFFTPDWKAKTIVIDLTDRFLTDAYRVRIVSSMEIYWDKFFFSTDIIQQELTPTVLEMETSHLHYRGVSQIIPDPGSDPESYDYNSVNTMSSLFDHMWLSALIDFFMF
ncbi:MAG TPA: hypothetical protein DD473_27305 [Planctomycetaceae bacterium]|nr:hypothetical protein [Planctomycetaceae bacterium]